MPKKPADISVGKSSPAWMLTYSDLITQLLIFFVMLFAVSAASVEDQLNRIKKRIDSYVAENKLVSFVNTGIDDKGLVISLQNKIMFQSGKADIFDEAKVILKNLTAILMDYPNGIRIEGHTDNRPINTPEFPSNWELSTARATNMARYLLNDLSFPPQRISAAGYGKYHPTLPKEEAKKILFMKLFESGEIDKAVELVNDTVDNRSLNRRVDIIVRRISIKQQQVMFQDKTKKKRYMY
ncbi:MAG: OmpA family protein [bacterium]